MGKPDWVLWDDVERRVTLEECVCLSLDSEPETVQHVPFSGGVHIYQYWHTEFKGALNTEKGKERLAALRKHFDSGSRMLPPQGRPDYYGAYAEKRVKLIDFVRWAHAMKWEVPEQLQISPTPAPVTTTTAPTEPERSSNVKPWEVADPSDPAPAQSWYTPARYFARQLITEKPTLLANRALLADKVSTALFNAGFKKRGNRSRLDSSTVLKAFVNVTLG